MDFLEEEVRCDFTVSQKRKKIWKIEIELILELQRVCEKYNLKYYASNGTLLGAVRHEGFVPWDDDVDVMMPRADFDKLKKIAGKEFKDPFFYQTADNDKEYFRNYARLRNINTTAKTERGFYKDSCHGIFIDIFPIDGSYDNKFLSKCQTFLIKWYSALANTYMYHDEFGNSFLRKIMYKCADNYCRKRSFSHLVNYIEGIRSKVSFDKAENVYILCHGGKRIEFPKSYLDGQCKKNFEYISIDVPKEYDELLKLHYGEYMELPPIDERGEHHTIFFDPDHSYKYYEGKLSLEDARKLFNSY